MHGFMHQTYKCIADVHMCGHMYVCSYVMFVNWEKFSTYNANFNAENVINFMNCDRFIKIFPINIFYSYTIANIKFCAKCFELVFMDYFFLYNLFIQ